ncbi:MAG TPA: hypothetical protein VFP34_11070 [Microlunatus sp.]|nr:hypothetical protein [Microlunatus sp.]
MTNTTGHPQPTNQTITGPYGFPAPVPMSPVPMSPVPMGPKPMSPVPMGPRPMSPRPTDPTSAPPQAADPGRGLGIVGLVLAPFTGLIGAILAFVALRRSSRAGFRNRPALAGVIIGLLVTVLTVTMIIVGVAAIGGVVHACRELGPGQHVVNGVTYTCG